MSAQYQQRNRLEHYNKYETENNNHLTTSTKPESSSSAPRQPLRTQQLNVERNDHNAGTKSKGPSASKSSRTTKSRTDDVVAPLEIEELRRKPNGEGHTVHKYTRGKLLGKGGFAKVYMCTSLDTNRTYAVKIVPKANLKKTRARQKVSFPLSKLFCFIH